MNEPTGGTVRCLSVYDHSAFRWGKAVRWRGPRWNRAFAVTPSDWKDEVIRSNLGHLRTRTVRHGAFLGGGSWRRYGPIAVCNYRERGGWTYRHVTHHPGHHGVINVGPCVNPTHWLLMLMGRISGTQSGRSES